MLFILLFVQGDYAGARFIGFAIGEYLGASALRIAGGIFTKIADIGADVMKPVIKIKEDNARNAGINADRTGSKAANQDARGRDFLDAAGHLTVRLQLRSLEALGGGRYTARAEVTIKGRSQTVAFPVELRADGDSARMTGALVLDRTAFGIGTNGPLNGLVGRQVTVRVSLSARRTR